MERIAAVSTIFLLLTGTADIKASVAEGDLEVRQHLVVLDSSRPQWPVVQEPSGRWGVVGEAIARHRGGQTVTVTSIAFSIVGDRGRLLRSETFDTPEAVGSVLAISRSHTGAPDWKPAGTTRLEAGDTGVAFLAALTAPGFVPVMARVTMRFDRAAAETLFVPLTSFAPKQRMGWPLRLEYRRWMAMNTAGTVHHWVDSAVFGERALFSSQRFALDIVEIDSDGQTHPASSTAKESHYAWAEDVLSAGAGRVVAVVSDEGDREVGETPAPADPPAGNFVVIQHGPRLFSVYAHLQQASALVHVGEWVERGQLIGLVGNSGASTEPHLHIHFTDDWPGASTLFASFILSQGVPAVFWGVQVVRDGTFYAMNGSTPLEFDTIVSVDETR